MTWEQLQQNWSLLKDALMTKWPKLTSEDLADIDGAREYLIGKLLHRYGYARLRAEQEIEEFLRSFTVS